MAGYSWWETDDRTAPGVATSLGGSRVGVVSSSVVYCDFNIIKGKQLFLLNDRREGVISSYFWVKVLLICCILDVLSNAMGSPRIFRGVARLHGGKIHL